MSDSPSPAVSRLIVVGGSAGSIAVLRQMLPGLPRDLDAAMVVVVHLPPDRSSELAVLLDRTASIPVMTAQNGQRLRPGCVYVAPNDRHVLVRASRLVLNRGPRENRARPAIDPLFRTAAACWRHRVIAVLLSGRLNDGTAGMQAVRRCGGITVVQDPASASYPEMPQSACRHVPVDHRVSGDGLAPLLADLVRAEPDSAPADPDVVIESGVDRQEDTTMDAQRALGVASSLTCPDCGGVLWRRSDGGLGRYRCHTGHSYSAETLVGALDESAERAMWAALRVHREQVELARQMIVEALAAGDRPTAEHWQERVEEHDQDADTLQSFLLRRGSPAAEDAA